MKSDTMLTRVRKYIRNKIRKIRTFLKYGREPIIRTITTDTSSFKIELWPNRNGLVDSQILQNGFWEKNVSQTLLRLLPNNGVFLDIGGNIGYHSLSIASSRSDVQVHTFEPIERLVKQIQSTIAINQFTNITVYPFALGEFPEQNKEIHIRGTNIGASSIGLYKDISIFPVSHTEIINIRRLDDVLPRSIHVDLIKIDVEGFELEALNGARSVLEKSHPTIVMEFSPIFYESDTPGKSEQLLTYLESIDYAFFNLDGKPVDLRANVKGDQVMQKDIVCKYVPNAASN